MGIRIRCRLELAVSIQPWGLSQHHNLEWNLVELLHMVDWL